MMIKLKIALRFLKEQILKSIIITIIIAIGSTTFYFILNSTKTLEEYIFEQVIRDVSHVNYIGQIKEDYSDSLMFREKLLKTSLEVTDVSYYNFISGNYHAPGSKTQRGAIIKGIDLNTIGNIHGFYDIIRLKEGDEISFNENFDDDNYIPDIVLSFSQAKTLFKIKGNKISEILEGSIGNKTEILLGTKYQEFRVVGLFYGENPNLNYHLMFTSIKTNNYLLGTNVLHGIDINIFNPLRSEKLLERLNPTVINNYPNINGTQWQQKNLMISNLLKLEQTSIFLIQSFTVIAISFSLAIITFLNVRAKYTQIGILKALGFSNKDATLIFTYQALIYSASGLFLGINLGNAIAYVFKNYIFKMTGARQLPIYTSFFNKFSVLTIIIITASLLIANIFPLRSIKKYRVIDIIKAN